MRIDVHEESILISHSSPDQGESIPAQASLPDVRLEATRSEQGIPVEFSALRARMRIRLKASGPVEILRRHDPEEEVLICWRGDAWPARLRYQAAPYQMLVLSWEGGEG